MEPEEDGEGNKKNLAMLFIGGVVLLALIWFFFPKQTTASATIDVFSQESESVDGAVVRAFKDGALLASGVVKDGSVVLKGLPLGPVDFKISKEDFSEESIMLDLRKENKARVELVKATAVSSTLELSVIDASTRQPVEAAKVVYQSKENNGVAYSDANGIVSLNEIGSDGFVSLKISKDGFQENALSVLAVKQKATVYLQREIIQQQQASFKQELTFSASGFALVSVRGPNAETPAGTARLYLRDGAFVAEAQLANGQATFENTPTGVKGFVTVNADGFPPFNGEAEAKDLTEFTSFNVLLQAPAVGKEATIKVESADSSAFTATVFLLPAQSAVVLAKKTGVKTEWKIEVAEGSYYAVAVAEGFISKRSQTFQQGGAVTIKLAKASLANSGSLNVQVVDENDAPIKNAVVKIAASDESFVLPEDKTGSNGALKFVNLEPGQYSVSAFFATLKAIDSVSIAAGGEANSKLAITLFESTLSVRSFDYVNNQAVSAKFEFYQDEEKVGECATPDCTVKLHAFKNTKIVGSAEGYAGYEAFEELAAGKTTFHDAFLVKKEGQAAGLKIEFLGLNQEEIEEGGEYTARLLVAAPESASSVSAYLRVGTKAGVEDEPAGIYQTENGNSVAKSTRFSGTSARCIDLDPDFVNGDASGLFKWALVSFGATGSREVVFKIKVREGSAGQSFKLFYRAEAVNGETLRYPIDAGASSRDACYSNALEAGEWTIKKSETGGGTPRPTQTASPTPTPQATPTTTPFSDFTGSYTPQAGFRIEEGKVTADVDEIEFQIDSVFPGDAVPIDVSAITGCALVHSFSGEMGNCFAWDQVNKKLLFKSSEFGAAGCPVKVVGNKVQGITSDAELVLGCPPNEELRLPLKVNAASFESFTANPLYLSKGDDSAKLVYLTSEKQAGSRLIGFEGFNDKIGLQGPESKAVAWHDGLLTITEDGERIDSRYYASFIGFDGQAADSAPRDNSAGLGDAVTSCSSKWCCANGWCSPSAFMQAFDAFKKDAAKMAEKTAFRRGNGEPAASLGFKKFESVVPMQVVEGADEILDANELATLNLPAKCAQGSPGVFEVTASTEDGKDWSYSASAMPLSFNLNDPGNKLDLCGFLWGKDDEIIADDSANLATAPQVSDGHREPEIGVSSYVTVLPLKYACDANPPESPWKIAGAVVVIPVPELELTGDGGKVQFLEYTNFRCTESGACCTPRKSWLQIGQRDNQMHYILHLGVKGDCTPLNFDAMTFLKDTALNWAAGELGEQYAMLYRYYKMYNEFQSVKMAFDENEEIDSPNAETIEDYLPGCKIDPSEDTTTETQQNALKKMAEERISDPE